METPLSTFAVRDLAVNGVVVGHLVTELRDRKPRSWRVLVPQTNTDKLLDAREHSFDDLMDELERQFTPTPVACRCTYCQDASRSDQERARPSGDRKL